MATFRPAALVGALLVIGCSASSTSARPQAPPPPPTQTVTAAAAPSDPVEFGKGGPPLPLIGTEEVPAALKGLGFRPLLIPAWLPRPDLLARVAVDRGYQVMYFPPDSEMWSVQVGCFDGPDPVRAQAPDRRFRGGPAILVRGYDRADHLTLAWTESDAAGCRGYFVSAYGLDDETFAHLTASLTTN